MTDPNVMTTELIIAGCEFLVVLGMFIAVISRQAKTEFKVDTMWAMFIQKATHSAEKSAFMTVNSPMRLTEAGRSIMIGRGLDDMLLSFWEKNHGKSLTEQAMLMQQQLGEELMKKLSEPLKLDPSEVLMMALEHARELHEDKE